MQWHVKLHVVLSLGIISFEHLFSVLPPVLFLPVVFCPSLSLSVADTRPEHVATYCMCLTDAWLLRPQPNTLLSMPELLV